MRRFFFLNILFVLPFFACKAKKIGNAYEQAFFGCACNENTNVIVGNKGTVLKGSDGTLVWEKIDIETDRDLLDICFNGKVFYATGHTGVVFASEDGSVWKKRNTESGFHTFAVASNQKKVVVVGNKRVILVSHDEGYTWEKIYSVANKKTSLYDVAFGEDRWIAVGDYGIIVRVIDATNEVNEINLLLGNKKKLKGVAFDYVSKKWVACGHEGVIFISEDAGASWKEVKSGTNEDILSIAFNGRRFVAAGTNGLVLTSKDAFSWNKLEIAINGTFRSVSCFKDKWFLVTLDGKKELILDEKIEK